MAATFLTTENGQIGGGGGGGARSGSGSGVDNKDKQGKEDKDKDDNDDNKCNQLEVVGQALMGGSFDLPFFHVVTAFRW